jgi:hypothetical protein
MRISVYKSIYKSINGNSYSVYLSPSNRVFRTVQGRNTRYNARERAIAIANAVADSIEALGLEKASEAEFSIVPYAIWKASLSKLSIYHEARRGTDIFSRPIL